MSPLKRQSAATFVSPLKICISGDTQSQRKNLLAATTSCAEKNISGDRHVAAETSIGGDNFVATKNSIHGDNCRRWNSIFGGDTGSGGFWWTFSGDRLSPLKVFSIKLSAATFKRLSAATFWLSVATFVATESQFFCSACFNMIILSYLCSLIILLKLALQL